MLLSAICIYMLSLFTLIDIIHTGSQSQAQAEAGGGGGGRKREKKKKEGEKK